MNAARTWTRLFLAVMVLALVSLTAGPAQAHTRLVNSSPAADATVPASTKELVLSFNQPVSGEFAIVRVSGPDGGVASTGKPTFSGSDVVQPLRAPLAAGAWAVAYRVISADGHPISGTYEFVAAAAPAAPPVAPTAPPATTSPSAVEPAPPAASADAAPRADVDAEPVSNETSLAGPAAIGVVVVAAGAGLLVARQRRRRSARPGA